MKPSLAAVLGLAIAFPLVAQESRPVGAPTQSGR